MTLFERYVGIDYSGTQTPEASLCGLRAYVAESENLPEEVPPRFWSEEIRDTAQPCSMALCELSEDCPTIVGIDHGFSFPIAYFQKYSLPPDWA